jgi:two-component system phosphate regulon response regulator PhoB
LRHVVYHFDDLHAFSCTLAEAEQELAPPAGVPVEDGEWVLAIFEVGERRRATAAAARGFARGAEGVSLAFERRDWERLVTFADTSAVAPSTPPTLTIDEADDVEPEDMTIPIAIGPLTLAPPPDDDAEDVGPPFDLGATPFGSLPPVSAPNARVLVIDDEPEICDVVSAMLDAVGLDVETAESAEEALERLSRRPYDILVLDWRLPGMTGIDLCRQIRREPSLASLPVLFLTAASTSRDMVEAFASGADDFVTKPFRAPELGARIFGLLRRARLAQVSS